jgi:hypothetical protein
VLRFGAPPIVANVLFVVAVVFTIGTMCTYLAQLYSPKFVVQYCSSKLSSPFSACLAIDLL